MSSQSRNLTAMLVICNIIFGNGSPPQKIIKGMPTVKDQFPYLVSLRKNDKHFCGGAIISEQHILTAAHCVEGNMVEPYNNIVIVSGINTLGNSGERHIVSKAIAHPKFVLKEDVYFPNDIAILKLSTPMKFNNHQTKINLPSSNIKYGSEGVVAGWGRQSNRMPFNSFLLLQANVSILDATECQNYHNKQFYDGKLCGVYSGEKGICSGDSGGPLAVKDVVVGVVSYGTNKLCGEGNPDFYTNVYDYTDFLRQQMT